LAETRRITEKQRAIIDTMRMHLDAKTAQQYLQEHGYNMKLITVYKWRQKLKREGMKRLYEVAKYDAPEAHIAAIEEINAARKKIWENIDKIKDPYKQSLLILQVIETLPLRSEYYDSTREVLEKPYGEIQQALEEEESAAARSTIPPIE
jgi:hypothetical protein